MTSLARIGNKFLLNLNKFMSAKVPHLNISSHTHRERERERL